MPDVSPRLALFKFQLKKEITLISVTQITISFPLHYIELVQWILVFPMGCGDG